MSDDIKLVICIPTAGMVPMAFAHSVATLLAKVAATGIPTRPECGIEMRMDIVESSNWITNREQLVRRALATDATHMMFLDDDMSFHPEVLEIMLGRRQPVVVTNYLIKSEPAKDFVAVDLNGKRVPTTEASTGLLPIMYSGFGVSLIETRVLREVPEPRFMPKFKEDDGTYTTEDLPFFEAVRKAGYDVFLDQDASKLVTHIGRKFWNWKEAQNG